MGQTFETDLLSIHTQGKMKWVIEMLNSHFNHHPRHEDKCDNPLHLLRGCLFDAGY